MRAFSTPLRNLFLASILLFCSCQENSGRPITMDLLGKLLMNDAVDKVIVITDKNYTEVYLDKEVAQGLDASFGLGDDTVLSIVNIEKDYFVKAFDDLVLAANLADPPLLMFEERPNIMDFITTYGLLLILICIILFLAIVLPLKITSQKRKIRDLESRISYLEQQQK